MYPYIHLWNLTLSMTGIWVVISFFVFVCVMYIRSNQEKLRFNVFFSNLIIFVLLLHILWKYFYLLFEYKIYFPTSYKEIMFFLPNISWFQYHFVWLLIACIIFFTWFLKYKTKKLIQPKRINIIFQSIIVSFIPLWFFLLLWDDFIWNNTNSFISIHPLTNESNLSTFNKTYPVWLFLSIGSFLIFIIKRFIDSQTKQKNWYLWLWLFLIMLSIVFMFQQYTRHLVDPFWLTHSSNEILIRIFSAIDVKQYVLRLTALWMFYLQKKNFKNTK